MLEIVDCMAGTNIMHAYMLINFIQEHRRKSCLPVMGVYHVGTFSCFEQKLHRCLGEKSKAQMLVRESVIGTAVKKAVSRMRLDKKAVRPMNKPKIYCTRNMIVEPRDL